jgi:Derlin-2/3
VLLGFSFVLGNSMEMDLLGIVVGHTYYFLDYVYPQVARLRGWALTKLLVTPSILHYICATDFPRIIHTDVRHLHSLKRTLFIVFFACFFAL